MYENQKEKPAFDLMVLIETLAKGRGWKHTYTQVLPDGRVNIQIIIEKKEQI
jgi:hypothetical protein